MSLSDQIDDAEDDISLT